MHTTVTPAIISPREEMQKKHLKIRDKIATLINSIKLNQLYCNHLYDELLKVEKERHELMLSIIESEDGELDIVLDSVFEIIS